MQVNDWLVFERRFIRCLLSLTRYLTDTVTCIYAMQAGARQMKYKVLECKEAIIQGEPSGAPKGDRCSLFKIFQRGRAWLLGAHAFIFHGMAILPLTHRCKVKFVTTAQLRDRS